MRWITIKWWLFPLFYRKSPHSNVLRWMSPPSCAGELSRVFIGDAEHYATDHFVRRGEFGAGQCGEHPFELAVRKVRVGWSGIWGKSAEKSAWLLLDEELWIDAHLQHHLHPRCRVSPALRSAGEQRTRCSGTGRVPAYRSLRSSEKQPELLGRMPCSKMVATSLERVPWYWPYGIYIWLKKW